MDCVSDVMSEATSDSTSIPARICSSNVDVSQEIVLSVCLPWASLCLERLFTSFGLAGMYVFHWSTNMLQLHVCVCVAMCLSVCVAVCACVCDLQCIHLQVAGVHVRVRCSVCCSVCYRVRCKVPCSVYCILSCSVYTCLAYSICYLTVTGQAECKLSQVDISLVWVQRTFFGHTRSWSEQCSNTHNTHDSKTRHCVYTVWIRHTCRHRVMCPTPLSSLLSALSPQLSLQPGLRGALFTVGIMLQISNFECIFANVSFEMCLRKCFFVDALCWCSLEMRLWRCVYMRLWKCVSWRWQSLLKRNLMPNPICNFGTSSFTMFFSICPEHK